MYLCNHHHHQRRCHLALEMATVFFAIHSGCAQMWVWNASSPRGPCLVPIIFIFIWLRQPFSPSNFYSECTRAGWWWKCMGGFCIFAFCKFWITVDGSYIRGRRRIGCVDGVIWISRTLEELEGVEKGVCGGKKSVIISLGSSCVSFRYIIDDSWQGLVFERWGIFSKTNETCSWAYPFLGYRRINHPYALFMSELKP